MEHFSLEPARQSEALSPSRILAIDDDESFREFLEVFFGKSGCRWAITSNMGEFKRAYHGLKPTAVLLDMVMPETDGFEVMNWLWDQGYASKLVIASGHNPIYTDTAEILGWARGFADVITLQKPMNLTDLRAALGISAPA